MTSRPHKIAPPAAGLLPPPRQHTRRWTKTVNDSGRAYLTPAIAKGQWMTRISIGGEYSSLVHVKELWDIMRDAASVSDATGKNCS